MGTFENFCSQYCAPDDFPIAFDYSRMGMGQEFLSEMETRMQQAFDAMDELEKGAIANPDEKRMVGHYWLRKPEMIPDQDLRKELNEEHDRLRKTVRAVHRGEVTSSTGKEFTNLLVVGIGGSALGPQFVADALGDPKLDLLKPHFLDNTDPDGITRTLKQLYEKLDNTLVIVISKSGGTPETRNGMLMAEDAYRQAGLDFSKHAIAITGAGSKLDKHAEQEGWLDRFAMYDWIGGRTSVMSAVGLLPAGLQGIDIDEFVTGAAIMDQLTRSRSVKENPAALLALCWYHATNGRGEKDMVILPYKDRLALFSKYLQQLVMESLGKEYDLDGNRVEQGITVYGNKGSTDQHAYVQQLRDGVNNFFVIFIEVLKDGGKDLEVEPGVTAGDYLSGFYQGTRQALSEKRRQNASITVNEVTPRVVGGLIALFERAVGFYASLVSINAYHQPGVEAGKKAAAAILEIQRKLVKAMKEDGGEVLTAEQWAEKTGTNPEDVFKILQHLSHNGRGVSMQGKAPDKATFTISSL